jgi:membrane associated rhomboid family serine protease
MGLGDVATQYFGFSTENLLQGKVWTLISALFLHGSIEHLLGNMIFLFVFGNTLEKELGATRTMSAFFIGGSPVLSVRNSFLFFNNTFARRVRSNFRANSNRYARQATQILDSIPDASGAPGNHILCINVLAVYYGVEGNVAYVSHIIGFLVGLPLGVAWSKNLLKNILITVGLFIVYVIIAYIILPYILQVF